MSALRRKSEPREVGVARGWFLAGATWGAVAVLVLERFL